MKILVSAIFFFFLLFPVRKTFRFDAVLQCENFIEVFRYVSSVENFQTLNPTILNITDWVKVNETSFYLEYSEYLSQAPAIENHARAFYRIQEEPAAPERHLVSDHETCFVMGLFCVSTDSILTISKRSENEVEYRERINYSCPWIFSSFCHREIEQQRNLIFSQLKKVFTAN